MKPKIMIIVVVSAGLALAALAPPAAAFAAHGPQYSTVSTAPPDAILAELAQRELVKPLHFRVTVDVLPLEMSEVKQEWMLPVGDGLAPFVEPRFETLELIWLLLDVHPRAPAFPLRI